MSELGKNAGKAAGNAARGVRDLARSAAKSTKRLGRIAKLNLSITDEKNNIKHLYTDIGRLYYEAHRDDPEGFFVQLFQQVDSSMEALEAMQAELETLKAEKKPSDADVEPAEAEIEVEIEIEPDDTASAEPAVADAPAEDMPQEAAPVGDDGDDGVLEIEISDGDPEL